MSDLRSDAWGAAWAALLLRVTMGVYFLIHAGLKLFGFGIAGTEGFFASLGLPAWFAVLIIALEVVGGVALILGWNARVFALLLAADLLGANVLGHGQNGFFFTNKGGGWEYPALWVVALLAQALLGNGAYAIGTDWLAARGRAAHVA